MNDKRGDFFTSEYLSVPKAIANVLLNYARSGYLTGVTNMAAWMQSRPNTSWDEDIAEGYVCASLIAHHDPLLKKVTVRIRDGAEKLASKLSLNFQDILSIAHTGSVQARGENVAHVVSVCLRPEMREIADHVFATNPASVSGTKARKKFSRVVASILVASSIFAGSAVGVINAAARDVSEFFNAQSFVSVNFEDKESLKAIAVFESGEATVYFDDREDSSPAGSAEHAEHIFNEINDLLSPLAMEPEIAPLDIEERGILSSFIMWVAENAREDSFDDGLIEYLEETVGGGTGKTLPEMVFSLLLDTSKDKGKNPSLLSVDHHIRNLLKSTGLSESDLLVKAHIVQNDVERKLGQGYSARVP